MKNENETFSRIYSKVANLLRDECLFIQWINKTFQRDEILFDNQLKTEQVKYSESFSNEEFFYIWSNKYCEEFVREITFENAEELTDQSLPFLILFHHPTDQQSIEIFEKQIQENLHLICINQNFLLIEICHIFDLFSTFQLFTCEWNDLQSSIKTFRKNNR